MARPDRRSTLPKWSLAIAALALAGCERTPPPANEQASTGNNVAAPARPLALPAPQPPLDRERLLLAVAQARSAFAAGEDDRQAQADLDGARFELRIRFGCGAPPMEAAGNPSVRHDPERRTVELNAAADLSLDDPVVAALAGETIEAVEGLWVPAPWLLRPACLSGGAALAGPAAHEVGIVQYFTPQDSRVGRRDERAYRHVIRLEEGQDPARPQGYELVLAGRLRAGPGGRVIGCTAVAPGRPQCLIGAEFETARIEDAESRAEIARWGRG